MAKTREQTTKEVTQNGDSVEMGVDSWVAFHRMMDGPDWGWKRAEQLAAQQCESEEAIKFGRHFEHFLEYLRWSKEGRERATEAARRYPHIDAAFRLWQRPELRHQLKMLVLADFTPMEIAERLGVPGEVVTILERMFFDVRAALAASEWIRISVFTPEIKSAGQRRALRLQQAYWGGRAAVELLLQAEERLSPERVEKLEHQDLLLQMRMKEALDVISISPDTALDYVKLYWAYQVQYDRVELDRQKFQQQCKRELQQYEVMLRRIAMMEQRNQQANTERTRVREAREEEKRNTRRGRECDMERKRFARERVATSPLAALYWGMEDRREPTEPVLSPVPARRRQLVKAGSQSDDHNGHLSPLDGECGVGNEVADGNEGNVPRSSKLQNNEVGDNQLVQVVVR